MLLIFKADLFRYIVISVIMILSLVTMPQGIAAAEGLKLTASSEKGASGTQVIVTIEAENAAGTEGGQFLLTFDHNLVRPVLIEAGGLLLQAGNLLQMGNLDYAPGQLMYMWVTVYGDTADTGVVCKVKFELLKEGETFLRFDEVVVAPDSIGTAASIPGKVTITGSAAVTTPPAADSDEPAEPGQDQTEPVQEQNGPADPANGKDAEEEANNGNGVRDDNSNSSAYIIGVAVLAVLLISGLIVARHLKKQERKRKKRKSLGRNKD
jgi:hypothetical protein